MTAPKGAPNEVKSGMTITAIQFRHRLETLDETDLESYSDVVEDFGAELLAYCDLPENVAYTGPETDLDDMCCRALRAIMRGETLEVAHAHISDAHPGAAGARAILTDLHAQWHTLLPA